MQRVHTTYLSEDITKKKEWERSYVTCVCVCVCVCVGSFMMAAVISHSGPSDKVFPE